MKKSLLILICLVFLPLTSCKEEVQTPNNPPKLSDTETVLTENNLHTEEELPIIQKPTTPDEIIDFADNLNVDTSMLSFDLSNVLTEAQLPLSDDAGDEYQNSTAYLGDSVTMGLAFFGNHPEEMVIAKGSINPLDAVDKQLIELEDGTFVNFPTALSLTGAKRAVLTFGSNAISVMSEKTFLTYYMKLLDSIKEASPDCQIIIQSITPLATTCTLKKLNNTLVNRSNLLLLVLAYSQDVKFLDTSAQMKDENGYLKLEYCSSDDGIHINDSGYKIWINMLRTHMLSDTNN